MKFAFIAAEKAQFPVTLLCTTLGVSRTGFYAWCGRAEAARRRADRHLALHVAAAHRASRRRYGSPRVYAGACDRAPSCGSLDAPARAARAPAAALSAAHRGQLPGFGCGQRAGASVHRGATEHRLGGRYHLPVDPRRLGVPGGDSRSVLAPGGRVGDAHATHARLGGGRPDDGAAPPPARAGPGAPLRSRQSVHQRPVSHAAHDARRGEQHEPARQLLGQRHVTPPRSR